MCTPYDENAQNTVCNLPTFQWNHEAKMTSRLVQTCLHWNSSFPFTLGVKLFWIHFSFRNHLLHVLKYFVWSFVQSSVSVLKEQNVALMWNVVNYVKRITYILVSHSGLKVGKDIVVLRDQSYSTISCSKGNVHWKWPYEYLHHHTQYIYSSKNNIETVQVL